MRYTTTPTATVVRQAASCAVIAIAAACLLAACPSTARADSLRAQEWFLKELRIPQAHRLSTGKGVTVAVIDSGIDASHPDLEGHVLKGVDLHSSFPVKYGWQDDSGHGTAMAGIIAAQGGGSNHALGVAPGANILPVKVPDKVVTQQILASGIRWATDHGADVINISLTLNQSEHAQEKSAIRYAIDHDVVVVAAAGNVENGGSRIWQPANIAGVVAVTGTTRNGRFWTGSASGTAAVLAAPADGIISTDSRRAFANGYSKGYGTSASAAIVSGAVALVRSRFPKLNSANVINRLIKTADDKGGDGWDPKYGYGLVNPTGALIEPVSPVNSNPLRGSSRKATSTWWSPRASNIDRNSGHVEPITLALFAGLAAAVLLVFIGFRLWRKSH